MNLIQVLIRVHRLGRKMHPELSVSALKHQLLMFAIAACNVSVLRQWYGAKDNNLLHEAIQRYPLIEGAIYWPYINHTWSLKHSLEVIDKHYRILATVPQFLEIATFKDQVLLDCSEEYPDLSLVLEKAPWFLREGEIVLSIFVGVERVYSVAFTLGVEGGRRIVYIGALQGRSLDNAMEIYRNLTHALHGMRPRDFLLSILKIVCTSIGVDAIWGVCSEFRQHNSKYFSGSHKEKLLADYDEVWREHGGVKMDNGFFLMPAVVSYRDISDIPSKKRAIYKRRYSMLDKLTSSVISTLQQSMRG